MRKVIFVLDMPPSQSHPVAKASIEAAATRWGADLVYHDLPLDSRFHPFWQKLLVPSFVAGRFGDAHVLQLDNDMVVRSDTPSLFDACDPDYLHAVPERVAYRQDVGQSGWVERENRIWSRRLGKDAPPCWYHFNAGLMCYGAKALRPVFDACAEHRYKWAKPRDHRENAPDEGTLAFALWPDRAIRWLSPEYNVNLKEVAGWRSDRLMRAYVYHYVVDTKPQIGDAKWDRSTWTPDDWPFPWDEFTRDLLDVHGHEHLAAQADIRLDVANIGAITNLLSMFPNLSVRVSRVSESDAFADTPYRTLTKLLEGLDVLSRRIVIE